MANQPKLVNKQFNSPIGLYSAQNVREVIEREQQILSNGAIGIDFQRPGAGKPTNLQNSAVLRMLEEEEYRQRSGRGGKDEYIPRPLQDLAWPPQDHDQKLRQLHSFKDVVIPGVKRVAWPPQEDDLIENSYTEQSAVPTQGGPQYSQGFQQNNYSQPPTHQKQPQQQSRPLQPLNVNAVAPVSPLGSPVVNQSPSGFRPATPVKRWAPVHSPTSSLSEPGRQYLPKPQPQPASLSPQYQAPSQQYQAPPQQYQAPPQQYQAPPQQYQAPPQQYQPPPQQYQAPPQQYQAPSQQYQAPPQQYQAPSQQYQAPAQQYQAPSQQYQAPEQQFQAPPQQYQAPPVQQQQYQSQSSQQSNTSQYFQPTAAQAQAAPRVQSSKPVEPPPSTITLRPQAPVSQAPPPLITSQPATATLKGGKHLRGDLKWPPENVRERMEHDRQHLLELAKGPALRPPKNCKDYSPFFEKHALNNSYPGYKIPPGTQFYRPM